MDANAPAPTTFIGGKEYRVVDPKAPPAGQPSVADELDAGLAKMADERAGHDGFPLHDYLDPDSKPKPRPSYSNADEALDELRARADKQARIDRGVEELRQTDRLSAEQYNINRLLSLSQTDHDDLGAIDAAARANAAERARFDETVRQLAATNPALLHQHRAKLEAEAARLDQEAGRVRRARHMAQAALYNRGLEAERQKLQAEIPALKDEKEREALIDYAVNELGVTRAAALAEKDPVVISRTYKQLQRHRAAEREAHLNRPRKPLFTTGPLDPAGYLSGDLTLDEATDRLRRSGDIADAMQVLTFRREREKERHGA